MSGLDKDSSLQDVIKQVDNLVVGLKPLTDALAAGKVPIFGQQQAQVSQPGVPQSGGLQQQAVQSSGAAIPVILGASGVPSHGVSSLQESFATVKDSVSNIQLPVGWKLNETQKGISQDNKDAFFIVKDAARYSETALKYLISLDLDKDTVTKEDIANLITVQRAQLELLGDKYATLRVKSATKNKQVGSLFESQLAGTSGLSPRHIEVWQNVAQIGANGGFSSGGNQQRSDGRNNRRDNYRGGGRYGNKDYRRNNNGRGFNDFMGDVPGRRFNNANNEDS